MIRCLSLVALLLPSILLAQAQPEYAARRLELAAKVPDGALVVLGAREPAQDYLSFEQNPSFY